MQYQSVAHIAQKWGMSERTVRNYCALGKIPGAFLTGKTWNIPENAQRPERINKHSDQPEPLLDRLQAEQESGISGGIYHKIQIALTYNSNHMEGSHLSEDQTRLIFETNTIFFDSPATNVDDIVETANHFRCVDMIITQANYPLTEHFIKELHRTLKNGTREARKAWFAVGDYKRLPNEVGGRETTPPEEVGDAMKKLLAEYRKTKEKTLVDLLDFHVRFERIHPFQDGNGRVGRLILFKECLCNHIVPFIITDRMKSFYYRGLEKWDQEKEYLADTCLTAQDFFKGYLNTFRIPS
jgi:Fic family protein